MAQCSLCQAPTEDLLLRDEWAGFRHRSACGHGVCQPCLSSWVEQELPRCRSEGLLRVRCPAVGCPKLLPQSLLLHACPAASGLAAELASHEPATPVVDEGKDEEEERWLRALEAAKVRNLAARAGCRVVLEETCSGCGERKAAQLANAGCGHAACAPCWAKHAEVQLSRGEEDFQCMGCKESMAWGLVSRACVRYSDPVLCHAALQDRQVAVDEGFALRRVAPRGVELALFQACPCCDQLSTQLFVNPHCQHSACENCWLSWATGRLEDCWERKRRFPGCLHPGCEHGITEGLWQHLCRRSEALAAFEEKVRAELATLERVATSGEVSLAFAPETQRSGPRCPICLQPAWALLQNGGCGHGACGTCWPKWAASRLQACEARRRDVPNCFAPGCSEELAAPLWQHCIEASPEVEAFSKLPMVAKRSRLRASPLFPKPMQVDCPCEGCWGLGYLGYDTIMCFICEYQWVQEDSGAEPADKFTEEYMGVRVKRCPKCDERIEKNGGCDHMTCRCGHQFYWTTLAKYEE